MKWLLGTAIGFAVLFLWGPQEQTVSVIIPCHSTHAECLIPLLQNYAEQTVQPEEVIVALSDAEQLPFGWVEALKNREFPFPVQWLVCGKKLSAGANRNRACQIAKGDILLLQDADDIPHPQRVEVVKHFFKKYRVDHLMHFYVNALSPQFSQYQLEEIPHQTIRAYQETEPMPVTYGCPAISRKVFRRLRWRTQFEAGEDCLFVQRLYQKFPKSVIIEAPLLLYRNELSSFRQ